MACAEGLAAAALILAGILLGGPASGLMAGALPDTPAARVIGSGAVSEWNSVGCLEVNGLPFSGVVVERRFVLTAAHVVGAEPAHIRFLLPPGAHPGSYEAASVNVFPGASFPYNDLALVRLKRPVPEWVKIWPVYPSALPPHLPVIMVGVGGSGNGDRGVSVGAQSGVMRIGQNVIDAVVPAVDKSARISRFYLYDFDGPQGSGPMGGPTLGNAVETMVAAGDSGSPVFGRIDGRIWLVGINNLGASVPGEKAMESRFGEIGGGMLLSYPPFLAWIHAVLSEQ